ncbi:outer membrane beta-barrel domain-containing protein [Stigmatella erecta]|uniref:Outer membrane beta-barrel protein n=1 Tax=Stigmatella erecta TaxID=83460 RepID=A0A1I0FD26_9BACT|nr:outer membrane beta-barrel domain-containing protein [Stigmatella erecta]SET55253.1 outer membrane beta-barrel protein [Stigmatella erecta]
MRAFSLMWVLCWAPAVALAQTAPPPAASEPAPAASSSEVEAGDVSEVDKDALGPLRERIRPVSGHLFLKKGRFEVSPSATVTFRDAFFSKYILGASLTYHPLETLGVGLRAGYALSAVSGSAQICTFTQVEGGVTRGCRSPTFEQLDGEAPGLLTLMAGVDLQWAPIYGKISVLAEKFLHFDMYGIVGASAVQYKGRRASEGEGGQSFTTVGGNVGIGFRFFLNRYMTVRTEVRDLIYVEKAVLPSTTLRNQLMFELGFSFFFPTALPES